MNDNKKLFHGLDRAAWGYFFLYFNITLGRVNLLPPFVGYLLFLSALKLMEHEQRELTLLKPLAILLALWHGVDWVLSLTGGNLYGLQFIDLIRDVVNLYFHFQFLTDIASIARRYQPDDTDLDGRILRCRTLQTLMLTSMWGLTYFSKWYKDAWAFISMGMGVVYVIAGIIIMRAIFALRRHIPQE